MKISVITVCYNSADTIADTLRSVASQIHPAVEDIIVDGGSTDGTVELIRSGGAHIAWWCSERDRGIYDAMNKGLEHATGEVVDFLNADDVYVDGRVLERIAAVMADPELDACYANLYYVDREHDDKVRRVWRSGAYEPNLCLRRWMPAHPTFYARRGLYGRFGGFDTQFRLQADFDLTTRFFELHHIRARYVPEFWVRMRIGGHSNVSWKNVVHGNLKAYRSCRKNGLRVPPWFIARKVLSRVGQFVRRMPVS